MDWMTEPRVLDRLFLVELNGNMKDLIVGFEGDMVGQNN